MPDFRGFDCDNCGACCRSLIVEADYLDAMREPRLYEVAPDIDHAKFRAGEHCIMLWDTAKKSCPFLVEQPVDGEGPDAQVCGIYQTRPRDCVGVEPGDAKCQQARELRGWPILCDRDGNPPSRNVLGASAEEYELDWTPYYDVDGDGA